MQRIIDQSLSPYKIQVLNSISVLFHINTDGNRIVGWAERPLDVETYICANGPAVKAISNLVQYMDEWVDGAKNKMQNRKNRRERRR